MKKKLGDCRYLSDFPEKGKLIRSSGGLRKLRWAVPGHGKRGGFRIIYYLVSSAGRILLLDIYPKSEKSDLTIDQVNDLKQDVDVWRDQL